MTGLVRRFFRLFSGRESFTKSKGHERLSLKRGINMISLLDRLYASQSNKRLFFGQGWGDLPLLKDRLAAGFRIPRAQDLTVVWGPERMEKGARIRQGSFVSPFDAPGFPCESRTGHVELVLPQAATAETPVCLHFAATGDEGFARRRIVLALPLVKHGIGSLILENPFYGKRRPRDQHGKMLNRFVDLYLMGGATVQEGRSLMQWLRREGYGRLGVCGISMGGHMAAQVGALYGDSAAIVACITPHSAGAVFTQGILRHYIAWDVLERELAGSGRALDLMRRFLDLTDIRHYPVPVNPRACMLVAAAKDAYIPPESAMIVHRHWPGSGMRWLEGGHVGAFVFHRKAFLEAIVNAFNQL
jgi:pimeloyl-ACP methyl ester carboxylesterase